MPPKKNWDQIFNISPKMGLAYFGHTRKIFFTIFFLNFPKCIFTYFLGTPQQKIFSYAFVGVELACMCMCMYYCYFCILIGVCWVPAYLGVGLSYRHGRLHQTFFFISLKCDFWAFQTISHIKKCFPLEIFRRSLLSLRGWRQDRFAGCR